MRDFLQEIEVELLQESRATSQPIIETWLTEYSGAYKGFWQELFKLECQKLKEQAYLEVTDYYSRLATALVDGYDVNYLEQVQGEVAQLVEKNG